MNVNTDILNAVLGRRGSLFQIDVTSNHEELLSILKGARVLVIGAAGSIGGAFVNELVKYPLRGLHLVDISENNLVEVVRGIWSGGASIPEDFKTLAIDYTSHEFNAFLAQNSYDFILNFSALKHVRSERDPFTLMRLLDVNVLGNANLIESTKNMKNLKKLFCVSSDKSVNPANLMGASKAMMERVFLSKSDTIPFSSARFANVAFSDGSLLYSFKYRIESLQPISAPSDVRRYFITHEEAGQLCLLGCFLGKNREIVYPKLTPEEDMMTFSEIAKIYLKQHGYSPYECSTEAESLEMAKSLKTGSKEWPCNFSKSDTTGEKMYEEFVDPRETSDENRFTNVGVVTNPISIEQDAITQSLTKIKECRERGNWSKTDLLSAVKMAVPELEHEETNTNLDQKM